MPIRWPTLLAVLLLGCRHRVEVRSTPSGATLHHGRQNLGTTPLELRLWHHPFARYRVRVGLSGHRAMEVDLARGLKPWRPRVVRELLLVPEHGPAGTWSPEELAD